MLGRKPPCDLAFDHELILSDARHKLETTSLATAFAPHEFTLSELRRIYEVTWDTPLDAGNFRRKVLATPGLVTPMNKRAAPGPEGGKPPELYRSDKRDPIRLDPPLRRPAG